MKKILFSMLIITMATVPVFSSADTGLNLLNIPFGGRILHRSWQVCLIPAPPPVFFIPIPFLYIIVGDPRPAELYYWFGISKKYRRDGLAAMTETSWALGIYTPGLNLATAACSNKSVLPPADGVIRKIGVSCPYDQYDGCESLDLQIER